MVQTIQAKEITLLDLETNFRLELVEDEWDTFQYGSVKGEREKVKFKPFPLSPYPFPKPQGR